MTRIFIREPDPRAPTVQHTYSEDVPDLHAFGMVFPMTFAEYENGHRLWWVFYPPRDGMPSDEAVCIMPVMPRHDTLEAVHADAAVAVHAVASHSLAGHAQEQNGEVVDDLLGYYRHLSHGWYADEGTEGASSTLLSRHEYVSAGDLVVVATATRP